MSASHVPVVPCELHMVLHIHMDSGRRMIADFHRNSGSCMVPVFRRNSDSHISASAYHNMGLFFSPGPFHYLFLTALVHPLSTCAYLLFLSHCNNYILPSHSRQPKLASCFILSSDWGFFLVPPFFPKSACFSMASGWGIFPIPPLFPKSACKQACSDACAWGLSRKNRPALCGVARGC